MSRRCLGLRDRDISRRDRERARDISVRDRDETQDTQTLSRDMSRDRDTQHCILYKEIIVIYNVDCLKRPFMKIFLENVGVKANG